MFPMRPVWLNKTDLPAAAAAADATAAVSLSPEYLWCQCSHSGMLVRGTRGAKSRGFFYGGVFQTYKCTWHRNPTSALIMFQYGFFNTTRKEIIVQRATQWQIHCWICCEENAERIDIDQSWLLFNTYFSLTCDTDEKRKSWKRKHEELCLRKQVAIARRPWRRQWRQERWYCQCERTRLVTDVSRKDI